MVSDPHAAGTSERRTRPGRPSNGRQHYRRFERQVKRASDVPVARLVARHRACALAPSPVPFFGVEAHAFEEWASRFSRYNTCAPASVISVSAYSLRWYLCRGAIPRTYL